jgi:hypothetical protein
MKTIEDKGSKRIYRKDLTVSMQTEKEDSGGNQDMLAILRNVILIQSIYIYFMGWTYAFYLFNHFGISLNSVDIPFYYYFAYSYSVITETSAIKLVVAAFFAIYLVTSFAPSYFKKWGLTFYFKKWGLTLLLIVLFPIFFSIAKERADKEALYKRMGYAKTVSFVFRKDATKSYPNEFINANNRGKLKLLIQTNDRFYVIYQPQGEGKAIPYGFTYDIARADILLAKIEVLSTTKKGLNNE